ncbi:MAG: integration host factor subunit beta [Burkholderiales bacterium]|nr:integration host factor subunit beta [Burkholderiales bacterium]
MNRSAIIAKLVELYPNLGRREVDHLVKGIFNAMVDHIIEGNRVEVRGFGCFSLKERAPGVVRNPRDGISLEVDSRHVVYFRAGKELKDKVNGAVLNKVGTAKRKSRANSTIK